MFAEKAFKGARKSSIGKALSLFTSLENLVNSIL